MQEGALDMILFVGVQGVGTSRQRRLRTHEVLPLGDAYADFVRARLVD